MDEKSVWFSYRDYRGEGHRQVMQLDGEELVRRFMLHLLPKRFMRIRYYGYLANAHRRDKLKKIRHALKLRSKEKPKSPQARNQPFCDDCQGPMVIVQHILPQLYKNIPGQDTS